MRSFFQRIAISRVDHLLQEKRLSEKKRSPQELAALRAHSQAVMDKAISTVSLPDVDTTDCNEWLTIQAKKHFVAILDMIDKAIDAEESATNNLLPSAGVHGPSEPRQDSVPDRDGADVTLDSADEGDDYADEGDDYADEGDDYADEESGADDYSPLAPAQQYRDPTLEAALRSYSASYSLDSVHSNKRSAAQEPDELVASAENERRTKRAKNSNSQDV
ncbi:hypothetical protein NEOLEDRAFT_979481 [Neolentinus lepideus HHB14362 ss-1]|uniref:Uncharacterized protein n=1 Tax=Neolentinus lepideus HHB14362 ss-1 TaxID=1314782 RepID=A0A165N920_9AGAM|nr:hypothetical protein NEOLEDRAFT_979481 [Neolentinus lepideus HHB14362 ss-1]